MFEKIPFLHRNTAFNIMVDDDISFVALHYLLDEIGARGAFETDDGFADLYTVTYEGVEYTVAVDGLDVMIVIK